MKKKFLFIILVPLLIVGACAFKEKSTVYICDSSTAKRYHYNSNCRGLNRCTHQIKSISLEEAKSIGRTICGYED